MNKNFSIKRTTLNAAGNINWLVTGKNGTLLGTIEALRSKPEAKTTAYNQAVAVGVEEPRSFSSVRAAGEWIFSMAPVLAEEPVVEAPVKLSKAERKAARAAAAAEASGSAELVPVAAS